ncbi:MAG: glutamate racemase [Acutalibacteraceae bacterium]
MSTAPIGVFDSGLGGLTAVKELIRVLPNENIIYFGDTGRVPYGNRSKSTIKKYALQDAAFLLSRKVKAIIAACGTVSSVASDLNKMLNVPYTGVLLPTALAAVKATRNLRIGVIGTTATIKSRSYELEIKKINPDIQLFVQDCPLFVPLVENGFIERDNQITKLVVEKYLKELKYSEIDTLILGCTHYPILTDIISDYMGNNITLINPGRETALYAADMLNDTDMLSKETTQGSRLFYVSDNTESFSAVASIFLGEKIENNVERINIEDYGDYRTLDRLGMV